MILDFEDYILKTDDRQFIVQKKGIVKDEKSKNFGNEVFENVAYYTTLEMALKFIEKRVLLSNDNLDVIKEKLNRLDAKIEEFTAQLKIKGVE